MFDHDHLPEVSWSQLEQLYIQGQQKWKETKRSILQQLHASPTFRWAHGRQRLHATP